MTARDDYPFGELTASRTNTIMPIGRWEAMCNEIDRLRKVMTDSHVLGVAKDELISELTKHADTMRDRLLTFYLVATNQLTLTDDDADIISTLITAYDEFIKEA